MVLLVFTGWRNGVHRSAGQTNQTSQIIPQGNVVSETQKAKNVTGLRAKAKDGAWTNSLGMKFAPAGTEGVLFCIWETRVQDFEAFFKATGHDATSGMFSLGENNEWMQQGGTWKAPGFKQGSTHPVVGMSWEDAMAFCNWLTEKERREGLIEADQSYRLPTDAEWSRAAGDGKYPWGDEMPPPKGAGNYSSQGDGLSDSIEGYQDGYPRTASAGSFRANKYGLYDMGGNVWEWCMDWYRKKMNSEEVRKKYPGLEQDGGGQAARVQRGGSWIDGGPEALASAFRSGGHPGGRGADFGFRCVVARD